MRPSIKTPEIIEEICRRLSKGEPMAQICRDEGMPGVSTVTDWCKADPIVSGSIARAREEGEDAIAADCLKIADTPVEGEETEVDAGGNILKIKRGDMLGHRKLQIDTRLKLLAKWNPKKWGEKTEHSVSGPVNLTLQGSDVHG